MREGGAQAGRLGNSRIAKVALIVAVFAGAALAANYVGRGENDVCYADFGAHGAAVWIGMAFMLTMGMIALAYMFGKGSEDEKLQVWARDEIFAVGIAALVVAGAIAFTMGSCAVLSSFSSQEGLGQYASANPFSSSYRYLDDLSRVGLRGVEVQTKQSLQKQLDATAFLYIGLPTIESTGVPIKASKKALAAHQEMVIDIVLPLVVSLKAQKAALQIIEIIGLGVLLPFAVIMRIIPFTRNAGNLMLAVVFSLYVVAPATYVLGAAAWKNVQSPQEGASVLVSDPAVLSFSDRALGAACDESDCALYQIGALIPQAVFMPNLAIVIIMTCAMALSRALQALPV